MKACVTFNEYHLGDNFVFLHLLRALAKKYPDRHFIHFAHANALKECSRVVEDLKNIDLFSFDSQQWAEMRDGSVNTWKNHDGHWERSGKRWNWVEHTLEHHAWTARRMGLASPLRSATDLLFDYPALGPSVHEQPKWSYGAFVCNSEPHSGQFSPMREHGSRYLDRLIGRLNVRPSVVATKEVDGALGTAAYGQSLSAIGRVSVYCQHHIMIATGPMWPTFNTHNHHLWTPERKRIVLLDNGEDLTGIPWVQQVARVEEAEEILKGAGLL